jgi:hypothetical protein
VPSLDHPVRVTVDATDLERVLKELKQVLIAIQEERRKIKKLLKKSKEDQHG